MSGKYRETPIASVDGLEGCSAVLLPTVQLTVPECTARTLFIGFRGPPAKLRSQSD